MKKSPKEEPKMEEEDGSENSEMESDQTTDTSEDGAETSEVEPADEEESPEEESSEGVKVPESFQIATHSLLQQCSDKACLDYLRTCISEKEDEYRKEEAKKSPSKFSMENAPSY